MSLCFRAVSVHGADPELDSGLKTHAQLNAVVTLIFFFKPV